MSKRGPKRDRRPDGGQSATRTLDQIELLTLAVRDACEPLTIAAKDPTTALCDRLAPFLEVERSTDPADARSLAELLNLAGVRTVADLLQLLRTASTDATVLTLLWCAGRLPIELANGVVLTAGLFHPDLDGIRDDAVTTNSGVAGG